MAANLWCSSFAQSICVIGYTLFPLVIAALLSALSLHWIARIPVYLVLVCWSLAAGVSILSGSGVVKNRVGLAVYPLFVFYLGLGCLCFISLRAAWGGGGLSGWRRTRISVLKHVVLEYPFAVVESCWWWTFVSSFLVVWRCYPQAQAQGLASHPGRKDLQKVYVQRMQSQLNGDSSQCKVLQMPGPKL
jgi:hypothetical protein